MSRRRYAPAQARYDNIPATVRADKQGFAKTGLTQADVHIAEVHDFFTGIELLSYADLGFADRFEADKLVGSEIISVGGSRVNPSGGLKSRGNPPEATGVAQCLELFEQQRQRLHPGRRCTNYVGSQRRWPECGVAGGDSARTWGR